jgi:hypothetical protein
VAEASGHGPDVDASGDELRRRVVAQGVQVGVDTEAADHPAISLRHRAWDERLAAVRSEGEDVRVCREVEADGAGARRSEISVLRQDDHRLGVEGDPALLVGLRRLLDEFGAVLRDGAAVRQHPSVEVDLVPAQGADLAAPPTRRHREPDERPPVRLPPRLVQDPHGLRGRGRLRVQLPGCRR